MYPARRVAALPVLLAIVTRAAGLPDVSSPVAALHEFQPVELRLRPLSEDASSTVGRARLGPRADAQLCRSCHEAAGVNPFYLRELTAALEPTRAVHRPRTRSAFVSWA